MLEKMFKIGKIVNTHGIRGEVKVLRITDFDDRFEIGNTVYIEHNGEYKQVVIDGHRVHKGFDLLHFAGLNNINEVEVYKGSNLAITESQLTELDENEYYYHEIIGCDVYTRDGEKIGKVKEILSPGANDVWVVQRQRKKDALIPYIEDVVKAIDVRKKEIIIEPMEGLFD